ncbi:hypothetical protein B484DRAFT_468748, partial [Ochromonadaceae sp. CCMP2298]
CTTVTNNRTNCPRALYFSSPLVTNGALGEETGITTSDNARLINENAASAASWVAAVETGGLIDTAMPAFALQDACTEVAISGWRIGTGSDITSVTLNGVDVEEIVSQTQDSVVVRAGRGYSTSTGDVVVSTSAGLVSTLAGGFSYKGASEPLTTDFESGIPLYWQSTGRLDFNVLRYCSSLPCANAPNSGPSVGHGGTGDFARVMAPAEGNETAQLDSYFNADPRCTDSVSSLSLYYHLWGQSLTCVGSLQVQQQVGVVWTTVATADWASAQTNQDDDWLPLTHTFSNPTAVTGVRIVADPNAGVEGLSCYYYGSVSIDDIVIERSTTCTSSLCSTSRPSVLPTRQPSLGSGETRAPSRKPSAAPSTSPAPSIAPSVIATSAPTDVNFFPHSTAFLLSTDDAQKNGEVVQQRACLGDRLVFDTCGAYSGSTYIRLYLHGAQVADNNRVRNTYSSCSNIDYTYADADCGTLVLVLGCSSYACRMTATVDITVAPTATPSHAPALAPVPTRSPSAPPSTSPSAPPSTPPSTHPSAPPSISPSTRPTHSPSLPGATAAPSSLMTQQLDFNCTQSLSNVTAEQFLADPDNSANFLGAVAGELGLSADSLCCLTVADSARRLSVRSVESVESRAPVRALQSRGVQLSYLIRLLLDDEAHNADALYDSTVAALMSSASSGSLLSALQAVLSADIVSAVGVEPVDTSSFSDLVVLLQQRTGTPSAAPSAGPGSSSGSSSSSGVDMGSVMVLGGIVVVAVVLLCLFLCCYFRKGRVDAQNQSAPQTVTPQDSANASNAGEGAGAGAGAYAGSEFAEAEVCSYEDQLDAEKDPSIDWVEASCPPGSD